MVIQATSKLFSSGTATARSFRELHRKYSSAQAVKSSGGNLAVPSDEDSDAAISFSEGRGTPLPPLESDGEEEDKEDSDVDEQGKATGGGDGEDDDFDEALLSPGTQAQFFTPDPPATPNPATSEMGDEEERLPSPPLQAVSA